MSGFPRLIDRHSGVVVIDRLELATNFWKRFCGWQFRGVPPLGCGLLLTPCNSIHTFGMRFAIDAIYLAGDGRVLAVRSHIAPWRATLPVRETCAVVEVPSGRCAITLQQTLAVEHLSRDRRGLVPRGLIVAS